MRITSAFSFVAAMAFVVSAASMCLAEGETGAVVQTAVDSGAQAVVDVRLVGASPSAGPLVDADAGCPSYYYSKAGPPGEADLVSTPKAIYGEVYPGVDFACYGDSESVEYVLRLRPGADLSLVRFVLNGVDEAHVVEGGAIVATFRGGEMILNAPVAVVVDADSKRVLSGRLVTTEGGQIGLDVPLLPDALKSASHAGLMNVVPAGGQPDGPEHDFYMSKFEVTNDDFVRFLNSVEANAKGETVFIDAEGNLWINPAIRPGRDEMFAIAGSRIGYRRDMPAGQRYGHIAGADGTAVYAGHPVAGVSWYGAVKYCNWLTVVSGRGLDQCCYSEGTNGIDWAPITATNWAMAEFSDSERDRWLQLKGFRLPMVNSTGAETTTNRFNEFYKAGAWHGTSNTVYGFGRSKCSAADANYNAPDRRMLGTVPVGFFDGTNRVGKQRCNRSDNYYGCQDISGNVEEWASDFFRPGAVEGRAVVGGSWAAYLPRVGLSKQGLPFEAEAFRGFRVSTTYMPPQEVTVHLLFRFYMQPAEVVSQPQEPEAMGVEVGPELVPQEPPGGVTIELGIQHPEGSGGGEGLLYKPTVVAPSRVLTVDSENPGSGVSISVSAIDINGRGDGVTTFTRTYTNGVSVTLSAPEFTSTSEFEQWLRNGVPYSSSPTVTIVMDASVIMTAVYTPLARLTVTSVNPAGGVPIAVSPGDHNLAGDGSTVFTRFYIPGTTVTLTAPGTADGNQFSEWLRDGVVLSSNTTVTVSMDDDTTMTAVYSVLAPAVSLAFTPGSIAYGGTSTLAAVVSDGTPPYVAYEFQYRPYPGPSPWIPSAITSPVTTRQWPYSIEYRVRVQDSLGVWSDWSNIARLIVGLPNPGDPEVTTSGL